jgi:hypothetical protein
MSLFQNSVNNNLFQLIDDNKEHIFEQENLKVQLQRKEQEIQDLRCLKLYLHNQEIEF